MNARRRELHRTLGGLGFTRDASTIIGIRYTGSLSVAGKSIHVGIVFDDLEFARLPRLQLLKPREDAPQLLAHIQADGEYCYANRDRHLVDRYKIPSAVATSLEMMRSSLERSQTSHAAAEIVAEFPQHWFGSTVFLDLESNSSRRAILYRLIRHDGSYSDLIADSERLLSFLTPKRPTSEEPIEIVRCKWPLAFQTNQNRPQTFADFLDWLGSIDGGVATEALSRAQNSYPRKPLLLVVAPNGAVGIRLEFVPAWWKAITRPQALAHYVDKKRSDLRVTRFTGEPIDPTFIYTRNLTMSGNLVGKRIALVGCGTIGSHLAKMLAQSGGGHGENGRLTLFDQQKLRAGNIGRHLLGLPDVGRAKAIAVSDTLSKTYPEIDTSGFDTDILQRLSKLDDYDLVIDATGDEGVTNAINTHFVELRMVGATCPPTIFVWLFGNGAAAQALCTTSLSDACYRCLRPDHGGPWRFSPLKSDYSAEEVPAQCGEGPFFPYGVAAPVTAAALALQLALDWAKGNASPKLRTQLIAVDMTRQVHDKDPQKSARCPACGAEHSLGQ